MYKHITLARKALVYIGKAMQEEKMYGARRVAFDSLTREARPDQVG